MNLHKLLKLILLATTFFVSATGAQKPIRDLKPTVLLISLDGFRADYLDKYKPPTLSRIAREGVRAKWMTPSFPSKTFPNHYSIATGLYPEHHGIIENNIYDFGTTFTLSKREEVQNPRWWLGEPIWVTAEKQGQHAAAFFFPGTEAPIAGVRPSIWKDYDGKVPNETRVDTVLGWFELPVGQRPTIITMYFSDVDDAGHANSPDSDETRAAVGRVDAMVARLLTGLKKRKIAKKVNLMIVSDHGMAAVDQRNAVVLDDLFDFNLTERILWTGEIVQIFPKAGTEQTILDGLHSIKHASCWRKSEIPERFHYNYGHRIAPIVCSSEEGWFMTSRERYETQKKRSDFSKIRGAHGYDNQLVSMRALFIGRGPGLAKRRTVDAFENIQLYNVMCSILGLTPAKNDGDLNRVRQLLR